MYVCIHEANIYARNAPERFPELHTCTTRRSDGLDLLGYLFRLDLPVYKGRFYSHSKWITGKALERSGFTFPVTNTIYYWALIVTTLQF